MEKFKAFSTPHSHPASLDSASTPEAFAKREVELGGGYLTCTDHGSLAAAQQIVSVAKTHKLTPIVGLESYFRDDNCPILQKLGIPRTDTVPRGMDKDRWAAEHTNGSYVDYLKYQHATLHFMDYPAYLCAVKLLSRADARAERHGSERKPLFAWSDIEELASHNITIGSSCLIGVVQRHLMQHNNVEAATAYFERLKHLFGDRMYVEVFPHVCSHNWVKKVFCTVEDAAGQQSVLQYYFEKKLRTDQNESDGISAEELANGFAPNRYTHLIEVKNYRKWEPLPEKYKLIKAEKKEGFFQNECTVFSPDGDLQKGCNTFVLEMAKRYGIKVLVSDDSHFAHADEKAVQDVRLAQQGDWKFHNCFEARTPVDMADGTQRKISEIKIGDFVKTYDFKSRTVVASPVTGVFPTSARADDFVAHEFLGYGGRGQRRAIVSTPGHHFWSEKGWTAISDIDTKIGIRARVPNQELREVIDGCLLGDGSISFAGKRRDVSYFSYGHCEKQRVLTEIIAKYLLQPAPKKRPNPGRGICAPGKNSPERFIFSTNSAHPVFSELLKKWYRDRKIIPQDIVLTPRVLAWWYMDDGAVCRGKPRKAAGGGVRSNCEQYRLYTNGFIEEDVDLLISKLDCLGIKARKYKYTKRIPQTRDNYGRGWFICMVKSQGYKLCNLIAPYVPPELQYKLPEEFRGKYIEDTTPAFAEESVFMVAQKKSRKMPTPALLDLSIKFDIEVANAHCFFVDGLLVHNSYHRQSSEEAWAYFQQHLPVSQSEFEGWIDNSLEWGSRFKNFKLDTTPSLPTKFFPADSLARTKELILHYGRFEKRPEYLARLKTELDILHNNGVVDLLPYFQIDEDVCRFYENQGWITGVARGSAGGLLLSYLLGITHMDPIRYGLSLERFITLDRIKSGKLPDIDQDLPFRDPLMGQVTDVVEVEMEDGTKHILPEDFKMETDQGLLTPGEAVSSGADIKKWWLDG